MFGLGGGGGLKRLIYKNLLSSIIYSFWFQGIDKIIRIPPTRGLELHLILNYGQFKVLIVVYL